MFISISDGVKLLKNKYVIAYPTESVFGLGCDPESKTAVKRLLLIKNRSINKGFILVTHSYSHIEHYIEDYWLELYKKKLFSHWEKEDTILLPSKLSVPNWITGDSSLIAIRISKHKVIKNICINFGKPIISTSANVSGQSSCRTISELKCQFGKKLNIVKGSLGKNKHTSRIINIITEEYIRNG